MSNLTIKDIQVHKHNLEAKISLLLNEFSKMTSCNVSDMTLNSVDTSTFADTPRTEQYYVHLEIRI